MKHLLLPFFIFISINILFAKAEYFQQRVQYDIDVRLNDFDHELTGVATILYTNNAPQALDTLWFHLWANAFKNKKTAFAEQQLRMGSTRFYFAPKKSLGGYREIDFEIGGKKAKWAYSADHPDIAYVLLPAPITTGEQVELTIPFRLRIPDSFSRLGHVGQSYQMTQWYPKPAVYDAGGWHTMPYLDMGEFYSEFGDFSVQITLPANYLVAATGVLNTEAERQFLWTKVEMTEAMLADGFDQDTSFPASSDSLKTLHYTAQNVHDFAWFADKRFHVLHESAILENEKEVDCWAFFTNEQADIWSNGAAYVARSVAFYSEMVGPYPWEQATAVQSALSAGAGMEYPMITVIGRASSATALDRVITHEVGHNWFYGILASNERAYPWMDEGINTYYENRYMQRYYKNSEEIDIPPFIRKTSPLPLTELIYHLQARRNMDQAPQSPSASFRQINYGLDVYLKTGRALEYLEAYLGEATFNHAMQRYYETWKFRHPAPSDFRQILENSTAKELGWFFDGLIFSNDKLDYKIKGLEETADNYSLLIKNKGAIAAPFPLAGTKNGEIVYTEWVEGFEDEKKVRFAKGDYDKLVIDPQFVTFDLYRQNNQIKTEGAFPKIEPMHFQFLGGLENPEKTTINWLPVLGWNNYDKTQLGVAIYSMPIPDRRFEYALAPTYGTGSGNLTGMSFLRYQWFPSGNIVRRFAAELFAKTYTYNYNWNYDFFDHYIKLAPRLTLDFARHPRNSQLSQQLSYRFVHIEQQYGQGIDIDQGTFSRESSDYYVNEIQYRLNNKNILYPYTFELTAQQGQGFYKIFSHWWQEVKYPQKGKSLKLHGFAGWMNQENPQAPVDFLINGITGSGLFQKDYLFDELLLGRNERYGILGQQRFRRDANLKTLANLIGSESWMVGGGIRSGIPNPLPIEPYVDFAIYPDAFKLEKSVFTYSAGIALVLARNVFEIYFPLLESDDIMDSFTYRQRRGYLSRISFLLNLDTLDPWSFLERTNL